MAKKKTRETLLSFFRANGEKKNGEKNDRNFDVFFKGEWRMAKKKKVLVHGRQKLKEINETNTSETFTQRQILFEEKNA